MVQESAIGVRSIYNINSSCQDQVPPPSSQSNLVVKQRQRNYIQYFEIGIRYSHLIQTNHCINGSIGSEIIPSSITVSISLPFDFQGSLVTR